MLSFMSWYQWCRAVCKNVSSVVFLSVLIMTSVPHDKFCVQHPVENLDGNYLCWRVLMYVTVEVTPCILKRQQQNFEWHVPRKWSAKESTFSCPQTWAVFCPKHFRGQKNNKSKVPRSQLSKRVAVYRTCFWDKLFLFWIFKYTRAIFVNNINS